MKANRSWTRTASGGTGLAADVVPGVLNTATDNVTTLTAPKAAAVLPLRGVALFYTGPTATLDVTLHLWEEMAGAFLRVSALTTLTANVITRIVLPAALQADVAAAWQTMHVFTALAATPGATNGAHVFYLWGDLGP